MKRVVWEDVEVNLDGAVCLLERGDIIENIDDAQLIHLLHPNGYGITTMMNNIKVFWDISDDSPAVIAYDNGKKEVIPSDSWGHDHPIMKQIDELEDNDDVTDFQREMDISEIDEWDEMMDIPG